MAHPYQQGTPWCHQKTVAGLRCQDSLQKTTGSIVLERTRACQPSIWKGWSLIISMSFSQFASHLSGNHIQTLLDNRLWFGLRQKFNIFPVEEPDQCTHSLSSILEHTEEYLKPITPLFTFPDTRYERVIFSEGSQGGGQPSSSHQGMGGCHQLKLVIEGTRGCCAWD